MRTETDGTDFDVLVVGAGLGGINALHNLRAQGLRVRVLEAGGGVGGTWYWNRYPGARVDIESLEYSYDFSKELQSEWQWLERYSGQEDVLRYLEWVVDRLNLRPYIQLDTHVKSAVLDSSRNVWILTSESGERLTSRYCVMSVGFLSATYMPPIPSLDKFRGQLMHSGAWPKEPVDFAGRRVGIIGTGASGVQMVPIVAEKAARLTVFQRTANWCLPIRNESIAPEYEQYVKERYPEVRHLERSERGAGMVLVGKRIRKPNMNSAMSVTPEERDQVFEFMWQTGGVHMGSSFIDLTSNIESSNSLRHFLENKIRNIVKDPTVAAKLIPSHPPLTKRPPGETGYFEAFNRENVTLVDVRADPIKECFDQGLRLVSGATYIFDVLVCATGFDAGTGPLLRIDIRGRDGATLKEHWAGGVRTHLGMMTTRFPNMFMLDGPQSPCAFFSPFLLVDTQSRHVARIIAAMSDSGAATVEPKEDSESRWSNHVNEIIRKTMLPQVDSWWMGANIPGKPRQVIAYAGGFVEYRKRLELACDNNFEEFVFG